LEVLRAGTKTPQKKSNMQAHKAKMMVVFIGEAAESPNRLFLRSAFVNSL